MTPLPPKQGLKLRREGERRPRTTTGYDTTSTKTRIETNITTCAAGSEQIVMTPLPPKQGLKLKERQKVSRLLAQL